MADERKIKPLYLVLLIVAGVAAIGMLAFNFLSSRSSEPEPVVVPTPAVPAGGTARPIVTGPATSPSPTPVTTEVFEIFEGRDPFKPLLVAGAGAGATPAPGGVTTTPAPTGSSGGRTTPRPAPTPRNGVQVEVLSVASDSSTATVRVGSTVHENVRAGQTLSSSVVVDAISGRCVSFHRGSERFTLCEGEQVLK